MTNENRLKATIGLTRRSFLKYAGAGIVVPTVIGMVPDALSGALGWRAYAQAEAKLPDGLIQIARKYGEPKGKFGKIGDPVTLTIGYQPYCTPYWTSTVNKQAQIWAKYLPKGSEVHWFRALSGPLINKNMTEGKNQFGYMAETPALKSGDTVDCDMVSVTGYDLGETGAICLRNDLAKSGKFKAPKDLDGQAVGASLGSFSYRQFLTWVAQNHCTPSFQNQSVDDMVTNLKGSTISASMTWEPYPTFMEQRDIAQRWITGQDMECSCKKYVPSVADHTFRVVGSTLAIFDWLRDRPDIVYAYLKSEEECRDMLANDPDLAAFHIWNDIAGHFVWSDITEVHPAVIRVSLDMMVWDGRITDECRKHIQGISKMWKEQGVLTGKRTEDPVEFVNNWADDRMLQLAIKELKSNGQWTSDKCPGFPKPVKPDQTARHSWKTYENVKLQDKPWKPSKA